ncbi:MAG: NFACT RNA binding domain-containing protein [Candidatus Woesearchaeota archaeon]
MRVKLYFEKSVNENAAIYFERAKKLKHKKEGAERAIKKLEEKLREIRAKRQDKEALEQKKIEEEIKKREIREEGLRKEIKKWFENYRWFYTTNGFLAVGGKDASTNETLIKKYSEKDDIVFHTEIAGSPFFVLKTNGKKPENIDIEEVAQATASFSRAWQLKIGFVEVYYVNREQVSKNPPAGEYIKKGAFMIYGKRNYLKVKLQLCVGIIDDSIIIAPLTAVKKYSSKCTAIIPGNLNKQETAELIIKKLGLNSKYKQEIIEKLPKGEFSLSED